MITSIPRRLSRAGLLACALIAGRSGFAQAPSAPVESRMGRPSDRAQLAANAADLPALAALLKRAGWQPTPELSGTFQPGRVYSAGEHRLQIDDCFDAAIQRSTYTSAEVVTHLQAGVSVGLGAIRGQGELVKRLRFGAPEHLAMPALKMSPTSACLDTLRDSAAQGLDLSSLYVVQEVLLAEIAEQTCGRIDARGRIVGLAAADASLSVACAQQSLEPVAVAYRTLPLSRLPGLSDALARGAQPIEPLLTHWSPDDRDQDGIADAADRCPDHGPLPGGALDSDGCPAAVAALTTAPCPDTSTACGATAPQGPALQLVFQRGSWTLTQTDRHTLTRLAGEVMAAGEARLRVEAHTDDQGDPLTNLSLSQARAEAVKAALIEAGVPAEALIARGFGAAAPIADNSTAAGRAQNRRTEVWILP